MPCSLIWFESPGCSRDADAKRLTFCHKCLREQDGIMGTNRSQEVFRSWHRKWLGKARLQSI